MSLSHTLSILDTGDGVESARPQIEHKTRQYQLSQPSHQQHNEYASPIEQFHVYPGSIQFSMVVPLTSTQTSHTIVTDWIQDALDIDC